MSLERLRRHKSDSTQSAARSSAIRETQRFQPGIAQLFALHKQVGNRAVAQLLTSGQSHSKGCGCSGCSVSSSASALDSAAQLFPAGNGVVQRKKTTLTSGDIVDETDYKGVVKAIDNFLKHPGNFSSIDQGILFKVAEDTLHLNFSKIKTPDYKFLTKYLDYYKDEIPATLQYKGSKSVDDAWIAKNPETRPTYSDQTYYAIYQQNHFPILANIAGGLSSPTTMYLNRADCGEKNDGDVYYANDGTEYVQDLNNNFVSTKKRAPLCHIIPYNHLALAWHQLMGRKKYMGPKPGASGFDDAHKDLAWGNLNNLRAGHASCNSKTASQGRGGPSKNALDYVKQWCKNRGYL
jgi:hypothetical protein